MITSINHITLAVSDLERSLHFYTQLLGLKGHVSWDTGAYLSVGSLWVCLSVDPVCEKTDYTHYAFTVERANFEWICSTLRKNGIKEWKQNKSEGQSFYFSDPDGHKLEIHVGDLESRLASLSEHPYDNMKWL